MSQMRKLVADSRESAENQLKCQAKAAGCSALSAIFQQSQKMFLC
jgi:hypothetical protein